MTTQKETRTSAESGAGPSTTYMEPRSTSDSIGACDAPRLSAADISQSLPAYILIVKTPTLRISRRVYLSLHAAVKACERAQARGHAATLELAHYTTGGEPR
ncbi:hypothetical protein [Brachybacterium alimentarium]|uniref:hypothetical protein n=1 Tax=Brachybacterium alimentarium TaxID=47845 RepID=UPI00403E20CB